MGEHAPVVMTPRLLLVLLVLVVVCPAAGLGQTPTIVVQGEAGPVWQSRNEVEIPNDGTATRFSLVDLVGAGPWPAGRLQVTWTVAERHALRALFAPLAWTETGVPEAPLSFAGATYEAGRATDATYRFNSYRLTYRYRVYDAERGQAWIGATAKLRDAVVELEQGRTTRRKTDRGFVPLLHLAGTWRVAPPWSLTLTADALAGGPGRAVDAALTVDYDLGRAWTIHAGYRTLEGGADVDEVYNFTWLHYPVVSVSRSL